MNQTKVLDLFWRPRLSPGCGCHRVAAVTGLRLAIIADSLEHFLIELLNLDDEQSKWSVPAVRLDLRAAMLLVAFKLPFAIAAKRKKEIEPCAFRELRTI